jgi:signal transduction histidine kinase/CheY-like chemotaxis protein
MDERIRLHWRGVFENAEEIIEQVVTVRKTHEKQELLWRFKNGLKLEFKVTSVDFGDGNYGELWLARDVTGIYDFMQKANDASLAKSMFLSSMSHEIRTPMNAIIGMTSLARKTTDLDKINLYLEKTEEAGHRLMGLINDVLDMSKIESGKLQITKQEFDYPKMLSRVINVIAEKAVEKQIKVEVVYFTPITRLVYGDELRISQVIINFLSNAVKFTPDNGKITITTEVFEDSLLNFSCTDTGIGISKEAKQKLFNNFEQADNSITRRYGGTGLGLAICKQIVELMGGEISVESNIGEGSKFAFLIPLELRGEITTESNSTNEDSTNTAGIFKDKHILLVEDVEVNRLIVAALLEETGCIIDEAENGEEAVELAENNGYELILMDVSMPVMDGLTATRKIRKFNPDIPIIAMTANAFKEDAEACIAAGMNAHIAKPIEPDNFMEVLTDWLKNTNKV